MKQLIRNLVPNFGIENRGNAMPPNWRSEKPSIAARGETGRRRMSAIGTKRTSMPPVSVSAFRGKADIWKKMAVFKGFRVVGVVRNGNGVVD